MNSILKNFRPNLIPNNPKSEVTDFHKIIMKKGGYDKYIILPKKDGCRLEIIDGQVLSRAMKSPGSKLVVNRFQPFADLCKLINIAVEGEFYQHGLKFNAIFRFFSKSDVTTESYKKELWKLYSKSPAKFEKEYDGLSFEFLTDFNEDLKFWLFDGIVLDRPDLVGYGERMSEIISRLNDFSKEKYSLKYVEFPHLVDQEEGFDYSNLEELFEFNLEEGFEGLVLVHKDHKYKFGRNSLNEGTLLKMKEDSIEYDGVILDVLEGTNIKDGIEKTVDKLGYSETSKKKGDRELSGLAKGFLVSFEDKGTFIVGLNGFDNTDKEGLLRSKNLFIGKHFKYTAMKPVKDFPRHAFFKCWRDEK